MQEKQREKSARFFFLNGCTAILILFEEINFLENYHTNHLDVVATSHANLQRSLANVGQQYMGGLSLPSFVPCVITCYANAYFVPIDPNALTKNSIHILGRETKPLRF